MSRTGLISGDVAEEPSLDLILKDFTSGMIFMRKADKIINHFINTIRNARSICICCCTT